jgi:ankyrin repeat protein
MTAPELMEQADEDGFKPIHLAVIQGSLETVNLLLANKVDLNAPDEEGHSGTFVVNMFNFLREKHQKSCS